MSKLYDILFAVDDTVGVAKLVIAPGCGPGGRGFESHHSPQKKAPSFRLELLHFCRSPWALDSLFIGRTREECKKLFSKILNFLLTNAFLCDIILGRF